MRQVLVLLLVLLSAIDSWAGVGKVTEQTGPTEIVREKKSLPSAVNTPVEMNDTIITARAKAQLTFEDNTTVKITEQSKLVIDDFVYDPKKGTGKVAMKVVLGTARYASGQIAKTNPQAVDVKTPTATVAVRGTDFSMTVDELGRSLVILLPSCPAGFKNVEKDCVTGQIDVTTAMGTVHLDKPFQSTFAMNKEMNPTKPVILALTESQINNMLILVSPKKSEEEGDGKPKTALQINFLDQHFLEFDELTMNFLSMFNQLQQNALDNGFLANQLLLDDAALLQNMLGGENQMLPNYAHNKQAGLKYVLVDRTLILWRFGTDSYMQLSVDKDQPTSLMLTQEGTRLQQDVQHQGGSVIRIIQKE